jgi:hypothetical protein
MRCRRRTKPGADSDGAFRRHRSGSTLRRARRLSGEYVTPYPPGIPALAGEKLVTEAIVDYLERLWPTAPSPRAWWTRALAASRSYRRTVLEKGGGMSAKCNGRRALSGRAVHPSERRSCGPEAADGLLACLVPICSRRQPQSAVRRRCYRSSSRARDVLLLHGLVHTVWVPHADSARMCVWQAPYKPPVRLRTKPAGRRTSI